MCKIGGRARGDVFLNEGTISANVTTNAATKSGVTASTHTATAVTIGAGAGLPTGAEFINRGQVSAAHMHMDADGATSTGAATAFDFSARTDAIALTQELPRNDIFDAGLGKYLGAGDLDLDRSGIVNDDGTASPDGLVTTADVVAPSISGNIVFGIGNDTLVQQIHQDRFKLANGSEMKAHIYLNTIANEEHIALVKGDISGPEPVLTRFHAENLVADIAGSGMPRAGVFQQALEKIDEEGRGVLVIIRNTSPTPFTDSLNPQPTGGPMPTRLLDYGIGAQIVADLGLREIELLSDTPRTVVALEGYDLKIVGQRPINGNK